MSWRGQKQENNSATVCRVRPLPIIIIVIVIIAHHHHRLLIPPPAAVCGAKRSNSIRTLTKKKSWKVSSTPIKLQIDFRFAITILCTIDQKNPLFIVLQISFGQLFVLFFDSSISCSALVLGRKKLN